MASTTYEDALRVIEQRTPEEKRRLREELAAADIPTRPACTSPEDSGSSPLCVKLV